MGGIIILVVILIVCVVVVWYLVEEDEAGLTSFFTFIGCMVITLLIASIVEYTPVEKAVSDYTVKKEIRKVDINGTIVSTDTVYVITKKKND